MMLMTDGGVQRGGSVVFIFMFSFSTIFHVSEKPKTLFSEGLKAAVE